MIFEHCYRGLGVRLAIVVSISCQITIQTTAGEGLPSVASASCENEPPAGSLSAGTNPVPNATSQATAMKEVRDVFKEQFANAKKDSDKLALAEKLQKLAGESNDDLAVKFVCFEEARRLVAETGDLNQAFESIDAMAAEFAIDVLQVRAATLKAAGPKLKAPALIRDLVDRSVFLIDQLQAKDKYQEAVSLATIATQAVIKVKDKALTSDVQSVRREAEELAKDFSIADKARETLKSKPDDAAANLAWGRWLCLRKDNWEEGLKLLQGADDPKLKELATRDLTSPSDKDAVLKLGTDWLDYAKSRKDRIQPQFAARALHWLYKAVEDSTGLAKSKVETQIDQAKQVLNRNSLIVALIGVVSKKVLIKQYTQFPEASPDPTAFHEFPTEGAILIGLNCRVGKYAQYTVVTAIQPVFATKGGPKLGEWHGKVDGEVVELVARDGYAVSDIGQGRGSAVDSIQVRFSRVTRTGLDLADSYDSKRIGGDREIGTYVRGQTRSPQPIIGVFGTADDYFGSIGVVSTK